MRFCEQGILSPKLQEKAREVKEKEHTFLVSIRCASGLDIHRYDRLMTEASRNI